ncbi:hypothetical protein PoB_004744700 [Plakobranchus ocellatus]|uniref:Uncharacterized protein n=1 Tax=Plakobranchus ocellatus TaxID=259542 RepID=A0AAV4BPQ8_9GAST|nr:hypothetical protein PoB_004744700 [Plakobranchus ocellatus]
MTSRVASSAGYKTGPVVHVVTVIRIIRGHVVPLFPCYTLQRIGPTHQPDESGSRLGMLLYQGCLRAPKHVGICEVGHMNCGRRYAIQPKETASKSKLNF